MQKDEKKAYIHFLVYTDENEVEFAGEKRYPLGQCLFDFVGFNFGELLKYPEVDSHFMLQGDNLHPYFKFGDLSGFDIKQLKKLQKQYAYAVEGLALKGGEVDEAVLKYRCICGLQFKRTAGGDCIDYLITDFEDCLYIELMEMLRRHLIVKQCKNCGKYFVPKKGNIDYCQRIYTEDNKTCAQVGYAKTFARAVKEDELLQAYTRAYKAHYARMTKPRKKMPNMTREAFEAWYIQAKEKLELARAGKLPAGEFIEWLKK